MTKEILVPIRFLSTFRAALLSLLVLLVAVFAPALPAQEPADEAELHRQLTMAENLLGKAADRPAVLYFIAGTHALLHEPHEALVNLRECINAKEGFDPSGDVTFASLKSSTDFQHLITLVRKDFPEVSHARLAFTTKEKDLVPEGLAYDPAQDVFYLSSMHRKKIVRIPRLAPEKITDFVAEDRYQLLPVLGIRMDPRDDSVWSASWIDNGKTELLHFAAQGTLLGRFSLEESGKHGFNDLVVLRDGRVFVTDTAGNRVYRFDPKAQAFQTLTLSREIFQPNGIAISDDEQFLYIADAFGVFRFELSSGRSAEIAPGALSTLSGADGLYWHRGSLIAVQNGIGSPRIAAFQLAPDGLHISKTTVLENRSVFTTLPTTGAIRGGDFYFIVNSQLDNLNGDRVLDTTRLAPIRIAVLPLD